MARYIRIAIWTCITFALPVSAVASGPHAGQVQTLNVITLSMQVGSTDSETKRVTYAPPPGWYVRSHQVTCLKKSGNISYSVSTVPQNWSYVSDEKVHEAYKLLIDLAGQARNAGLRAKFSAEQGKLLNEVKNVRSTHHALVVDATVRGEGLLRGGGSLDLTVTAELVYVGVEVGLARMVAENNEKLK